MRTRMLLLAALAVAACARTETPEQMAAREQAAADSARPLIEDVNARFVRYTNANQPESVATLYAANAKVMPPNMATAVGRDSIRALYAALGGGQIAATVTSVASHGPLGVFSGTYEYAIPAAPGRAAMTDRGKFINHVHLMDGRWMVVETMWNSDLPPMPAPPARR